MLSQKVRGAIPLLLTVSIGALAIFSINIETAPVNSYTQSHAHIYSSSFDNKLDE